MKQSHLEGTCYGGPHDGKRFLHTADMRRVKLLDGKKAHIYAHCETLSAEQGRPVFVHESIEPWKLGG